MANVKQVYNWERLPVSMDVHTTALVMGVTDETIKNWLRAGRLKGSKIGRKWIIDRDYLREIVRGAQA